MTRDQALAKIKKCLALAASANPNEAATALRQAQKLMSEHSINASDPTLQGIHEVSTSGVMASAPVWEQSLVAIVTRSFGCTALVGQKVEIGLYGRIRIKIEFTFIGLDSAPTVAAYAFSVLSRQCAKGRLAHIAKQSKYTSKKTKTARGDAYALGWVIGVRDKLTEFANPPKVTALIAEYQSQHHPKLGESKSLDRTKDKGVTRSDMLHGMLEGRRAQLNHGVAGRESQGLLGVSP